MENKDHRLKYVEMPGQFYGMANEIEISAKQQLRSCENFGKKLMRIRPKDAGEFDRIEKMKDFLLASHDLNTRIIQLITKVHELISQVSKDANMLMEGAVYRNKLKDCEDTIVALAQHRDTLLKEILHDRRGV